MKIKNKNLAFGKNFDSFGIKKEKYIIAIDGGGTKTVAILSDLEGNILFRVEIGPSSISKTGFTKTIDNLAEAIEKVSKDSKNIVFIYIALAGELQRDIKRREEIKKEVFKKIKIFLGEKISHKKILIESDDLAAFWSGINQTKKCFGTDQKDGVVLIAGTGSIAVGWKEGKQVIVGGWGYLISDEGSSFWIGQKALQAICHSTKTLHATLLKEIIFEKLKINNDGDLIRKIYNSDVIETIASLAFSVNVAAQKGCNISKNILIEAGDKLAMSANQVIKELNFKSAFPLVLVGGAFNSKIVLNQIKDKIKKEFPKVRFIRPKADPVIGAVKLAIENYKKICGANF